MDTAQSELLATIQRGDFDRFASLLAEHPDLVNRTFPDGETALHIAVENNDPAMVRRLVELGASLDARYGMGGHTPLSWAVTTCSFYAAVELVLLGAKPDLFCAAGMGRLDLVKSWFGPEGLLPGASQTGSSRYGESGELLPAPPTDPKDQVSDALYIACRCGRTEVAQFLLEQGADPNWRGYIRATPLHWAEFSQAPGLAALVRTHGGSDELRDASFQATPNVFRGFVLAGWGFPVSMLADWLDRHPEHLHAATPTGTLLDAAVRANNQPAIDLLRERGIPESPAGTI